MRASLPVAVNEPASVAAAMNPLIELGSLPLPTLQMNVLRKHFERHEVSPDEVAALGYAALKRLPGLGGRGIEIVRAWLRSQGLDVANPPTAGGDRRRSESKRRRIEQAIALLRNNGFVVRKRRE